MTVSKKVYKDIRKWARLRSLDYKTCKRMYKDLSPEKRGEMEQEVNNYITAVESGRITPSKPVMPGSLK